MFKCGEADNGQVNKYLSKIISESDMNEITLGAISGELRTKWAAESGIHGTRGRALEADG